MAGSIVCGNCSETIIESAGTPVEKRKPCPKCGSIFRAFSEEVAASISISATATATLITYSKALLTIAQSLIDQGHFNIAMVTVQMACEVAAERAFDAAYATKNLKPLGEAVDGLMNGHSLANDKHRRLYNALTGVEIEKQSFWSRYKAAVMKRNEVVHKQGQADKSEALDALAAAGDLVIYLKQM